MNKSLISILITATLGLSQSYAMTALNDEELSEVEGQSLMNLEFQQGTNTTDAQGKTYNQSNIGFYKLALSAELELNANIKKLQLGCGGDNNSIRANSCDIDIDHISLSGLPDDPNYTSDQRAATSALITNPFIQFAIKNPTSAATREVLGFRVSAEKIVGLLTAGTNDGTQNGINTLSGYMKIAPATGSTKTQETPFTQSLTGKVNIDGCFNCPRTFVTSNSTIKIPSMPVNFTTKEAILNGSRLTSVNVKALADVPTISLTENSGNMKAVVEGTTWVAFIPLNNFTISDMRVNMQISGLKTDIALNQSLGLIHSLPLNNPVSLSLQKSKLFWPKEQAVAEQGWWLAVNDPVQLGTLNASENYAVDINPILPNVATYLSDWFDDNPLHVDFGSAVSALFTSKLVSNVGPVELGTLPALPLPLNNIPLGASQNVISNCYGGLKFC